MTETNQYIQVVEEQTEQLSVHPLSRVVGGWSELGGQDQEYDRKFVSKPRVETTERVSQGTVVSQWTKMPGDKDRVRVAHSKVIRPRVGQQEQGDMLSMSILPPAGDISATLLYSSMGMVWRDVGSQVTPNRVNGLPTDREEEQRQVDRIKQFLGCGGVLDRSCSGCGKVSRQRNLVMAGFSLLSVPDLLHPSIISACGMMVEGDRTQVYQLDPGYGQVALSGTAEMALGEYLAGKTLTREQLPGLMCAVSRCYRAETGRMGEEKGLYRVHQFTKVEMFCVNAGQVEESSTTLAIVHQLERELFTKLGLSFRVLDMCADDNIYYFVLFFRYRSQDGEISQSS